MIGRKGTTILYLKLQKALHGLLRSALLFYNKPVVDLESDGFVLNPCDLCMANKVVEGKQMTVCWHVGDLKVSHCDPVQVTIFGEWLSEKYGMAVATHWGKVHDYLRMIVGFSAKGKLIVTMMEYIKNIIKDFPEEITGTKTSPHCGPYFRSEGPVSGKGIDGGAGDGIPSCNGPTPVSECKGTTGHPIRHCLSDHPSEVVGQR